MKLHVLIRFQISLISYFPNIESYRQFRFALYMEIMKDSKRMSAQKAFSKWIKITRHNMKECEQDFLRIDSFKFGLDNYYRKNILLLSHNILSFIVNE